MVPTEYISAGWAGAGWASGLVPSALVLGGAAWPGFISAVCVCACVYVPRYVG